MISEIIPEAYDCLGTPTSMLSHKKLRALHPSYPIGRFLSQPLSTRCASLQEIRGFLRTCNYVSDEEQFGKRDHWMPPEQFEIAKKGDCEDFAIWTWRQLMNLGYKTRLVFGRSGRYGEGHAWVMYFSNGKHYILEPLAFWLKKPLPRLSGLRYQPQFSIEWDGEKVCYFTHKRLSFNPSIGQSIFLVSEWCIFWVPFWSQVAINLALYPLKYSYKIMKNTLQPVLNSLLRPPVKRTPGG